MPYVPIFTYNGGANPPIDYPRLLISDTVELDAKGKRIYVFADQEIQAATQIEASVWMSPQFYSPPAGTNTVPNPPFPWRRIAATLIDALAANQGRLTILSQLLDVKLNPGAPKEMRALAQSFRDTDDNSGAYFITEQVNDVFSFRDRFWKQVQRESGGGQ